MAARIAPRPLPCLARSMASLGQVRAARAVGVLLQTAGDLPHPAAALAVALVERLEHRHLLLRREPVEADAGHRSEIGRLGPPLGKLALRVIDLGGHLGARRNRLARFVGRGVGRRAAARAVIARFASDQKTDGQPRHQGPDCRGPGGPRRIRFLRHGGAYSTRPIRLRRCARRRACRRRLEVELAGEHVIDHRVDGLEVTVAAKLLALELLEGLVGPLVDESAHGHSP